MIADAAATVATFAFSVVFNNASVYDPYWSAQPPVILIAFAIGKHLSALGILLFAVVSFWAIRPILQHGAVSLLGYGRLYYG